MSVILVDTKYFGVFLKSARKTLGIKRQQGARMFGISPRQMSKIENGKLLIPEPMLEKIICNGMAMILCKRRK